MQDSVAELKFHGEDVITLDRQMVPTQEEYLRIEHVSKHFGGVQALNDAALCCRKGETHVLIGENGAGKSTIVKILCGVVERDAGEIFIGGSRVEINNAVDAEKYRIAAVFQELSLIQELSVAENIFLGHELTNKLGKINFNKMYEETDKFLHEIGVSLNPRKLVRDLSLCEKQMVEIAKALYKNPEILILDEATSALGEHEVEWLFKKIREFTREKNNTIIFISHRMDELHQVADRATIFRDARYILTFKWGELSDEQIVNCISGKAVNEKEIKRNKPLSDEIVMEIKNGFRGNELHDLNIQLKKGEILGIAGLSGHGQEKMLHAIFGDGVLDEGDILVEGKPVKIRNERDALKHGIVLVPEDRKNEGLILERPISENITLMALKNIQKYGVLRKSRENQAIGKSINDLNIKSKDVRLNVNSLSGGNQQKVVIAKALLTDVKVLLLSDPTRGIDIGTKNEIYKLMNKLSEEGISILFLSTELSELVLLCSRVLVFYEGSIAAELVDDQINEENIISHAIGVGCGGNEYEE
jgi:ribose transport system ATP-binding protein